MELVEFTGKSTEEAMLAAQEHFSLSLDQLEVEVISAGGSGFLGLGSKKAVIKARPRGKSQADEVAELVAALTDSSEAALGLGKKKPKPPAEPPAPAERPQPAPQATAKSVAKPQAAPPPPPRAEAKPRPQAATPPPPPARPERPEPPAPRRERAERNEEGPELQAYALEVLGRLAQALDPQATVEALRSDQGLELNIGGGEPGVLIGRRGQTLDALQYLTTRIVSHKYGRAVHLSVDAGGYRSRRRASLEDTARKAADKARATRKAQSIGPLSAQERRVVHLVLRSQKGISTMSRGKGELKKVVVTPR